MNPRAVARRDLRVAGLYAITPDLADTDLLVELVDAALSHGARLVQYRNKSASPALRITQANALGALCRRHARALIINDHVDLALSIDAAGVHVGTDDADDLGALRRRLGPDRLLGVSCYQGLELARRAVAAGADYVAFGSVFPSTTKPHAVAADLSLFAAARDLGVPLVGIGGITRDNIAELVAAGADAAAVINDLFEPRDVGIVRVRALALATSFHPSTENCSR